MRCNIIKIFTLFLALSHFSTVAEDLEFSGYVRVIGGYLDEERAKYKGYDDNVNFEPASLMGLQADYYLNEQWSVTGQVVARAGNSSPSKTSGLEWLYVTYRPIDTLQVKVGKLRAPFFAMSDFSNVGFAYPWVNLPQQVYDTFMFDTFNGIDVIYKLAMDKFDVSIEGYFGEETGEIEIGNNVTSFEANNLMGLIGKFNFDNFEFRAAKYNTDLNLQINALRQLYTQLNQLGFEKSANSIETHGSAYAEQVSIFYDNLDYFLRAEWVKIKTDLSFVPEIQSYYLTAGFNYKHFTYHLTFGDSDVKIGTPVDEIDPSLDKLAMNYQYIFNTSEPDALQTWTIGARWDFMDRLALKVEFSKLVGGKGPNSFFTLEEGADFDRQANLYLIGLDWVF
ncbi:hypothetical protein [Pseudoalteromonas sp.]|uniref:hypothetical protein n=1 Tax=Pseudoalteromonas sp. TaxID=53249 RepID=UPI0035672E65